MSENEVRERPTSRPPQHRTLRIVLYRTVEGWSLRESPRCLPVEVYLSDGYWLDDDFIMGPAGKVTANEAMQTGVVRIPISVKPPAG